MKLRLTNDRKRLSAAWQEYRVRVVPVDASPFQLQESRRAFYAGAASLVKVLADVESEVDVDRLFTDAVAETEQFVGDVGTAREREY